MTKKQHKKITQPEKPVAKKVEKPVEVKKIAGFELIRFDRKANIFIAACVALYILFTLFKLHNSSIPIWNQIINDGNQKRGLIEGKPLSIRSDEWMVVSSFTLAQKNAGYPVSNEALGYGKTPLLMGLPTTSILSSIRPALWGYYLLDVERGFSWQWNFKIFPFLIASFLLLMLLTRNNFWVSMLGSLWILLSSSIQWWSINTEMFTLGCFSLVTLIYILYSAKPKIILINGILFLLAAFSFIMLLYPPYQVPFGYFLVALFAGYMIRNKKEVGLIYKNSLPVKAGVLAGCIVVIGALLFLFMSESKETINVITNTVYPGKRNEHGGNYSFPRMFTDNFSMFMNESKFPQSWGNICELSADLMLFPAIILFSIIGFFRTKKIDALLASLIIFHLVAFAWMVIGFPEFLAKLSLINMSPASRTFYVVGFTNIIATLVFLGSTPVMPVKKKNIVFMIITFVVLYVVIYYIHTLINDDSVSFFSADQVMKATLVFALLNWLAIYFSEKKVFQISFFAVCLLFVLPNIKINPLCSGLTPYTGNTFYQIANRIKAEDPKAGWVVYGQITVANFLKATGINCFSGVQYAPPLEKIKVLDPEMKKDSVYNRYAHVAFSPFVNGVDSVRFNLVQNDLYQIQMDPCSPRFQKLGIKYFLFTYRPNMVEVRDMSPVDTSMFYIYKRNQL